MAKATRKPAARKLKRLPAPGRTARAVKRASHHQRIALALQGGGALGAYQAGVYEALHQANYEVDWVSGVSIGAINSAIIAGNPPERRVERLHRFWEIVSTNPGWVEPPVPDLLRDVFSELSSNLTVVAGRPGFFEPRVPPPWLLPPKLAMVTSYYDTAPLRATLEELIDFDRINHDGMKISVGAVNVETGNYIYFANYPTGRSDTVQVKFGPEHVMASGALPPGFPPVEIDGKWYWDGGIISNTPLNHLLAERPRTGTLAFQVDLFSARGPRPGNLAEVMERQKDISYSSRTREMTKVSGKLHGIRVALTDVLAMVPASKQNHPSVRRLRKMTANCVYDIVHLIYRSKYEETHSKDYEFSLASMESRWTAGAEDARAALARPDWLKPPGPEDTVRVHDPLRETQQDLPQAALGRG
jgi:NTE family protein